MTAGSSCSGSGAATVLGDAIERFGLSDRGRFERLCDQLGAMGEVARTAKRRALLLWALAWAVPLLLCLAAGTALGAGEHDSFLRDWGAWTRFCIVVPMLVLIDRMVDEKLRRHLRQFAEAPLIAAGSMGAAADAVAIAIRRGRSLLGEAVCLLLAIALSLGGAFTMPARNAGSWLIATGPDGAALTVAGWWAALVSSPIFWFLLLRWLWRHLVWALLLRRLARLRLRLVVTHPDGVGGLGFLGKYPNVFVALVLAMSLVLGAAIARAFEQESLSLQAYSMLMGTWLAFVLALFAFPLASFAAPLSALKEATERAASVQATNHFRNAERKMLGTNIAAPEASGPEAEADDPTKLHAAAQKLKVLPFNRAAILPIGAAALVPMIAAGLTQLPFGELWKVAKRLLLL
ncbi:hypothetical protein [Geminicoccus roseus]|uniref:hypothetical protein n=1 Tax=Geminicoccus roseus TaxID=404900 RepID=UPI0012F8A893|nr:hypothetical protein [Geminicoccus roseus]